MNFEYEMYDLIRGFIGDIEKARYFRSLRSTGYDTLVLERSLGRPYETPEPEGKEKVLPETDFVKLGECFYLFNRPCFKAVDLPEELADVQRIVMKNTPIIPNHMIGYSDEDNSVVVDCDLDGALLEEVQKGMEEGMDVELSSDMMNLLHTIEKKYDVFSVSKDRVITAYQKDGRTYRKATEMMLKSDPQIDGFSKVVRIGKGTHGKALDGVLVIGV